TWQIFAAQSVQSSDRARYRSHHRDCRTRGDGALLGDQRIKVLALGELLDDGGTIALRIGLRPQVVDDTRTRGEATHGQLAFRIRHRAGDVDLLDLQRLARAISRWHDMPQPHRSRWRTVQA